MKKNIEFYGPVDMSYGPGIKNSYTIKNLNPYVNIKLFNTYKKNFIEKILFYIAFIFSNSKSIIAVSTRGRSVLLPIAYLKKKLNKNYRFLIISINGYLEHEFTTRNKLKNYMIIKALENADRIYLELNGLVKMLEKYNIKNGIWFPNFKPDEEYLRYEDTENSKKNEGTLKCVFLARVCLTKGIDYAISSVKKLREEGLNISLDIYGPIANDAEKIINSIKTCDFIKYKGNIENRLVTSTLRKYNLFLFPTRHKREGFPASILDAYSAALPVISSDISYNSELVLNNINGSIYKQEDYEQFEDCIKYYYFNRNELIRIGKNNFKKALDYKCSKVFSDLVEDMKSIEWI